VGWAGHKRPVVEGEGQWECSHCTLLNQATAHICDACEQPRSGGGPTSEEEEGAQRALALMPQAAVVPRSDSWTDQGGNDEEEDDDDEDSGSAKDKLVKALMKTFVRESGVKWECLIEGKSHSTKWLIRRHIELVMQISMRGHPFPYVTHWLLIEQVHLPKFGDDLDINNRMALRSLQEKADEYYAHMLQSSLDEGDADSVDTTAGRAPDSPRHVLDNGGGRTGKKRRSREGEEEDDDDDDDDDDDEEQQTEEGYDGRLDFDDDNEVGMPLSSTTPSVLALTVRAPSSVRDGG
jgi:hypothetical protein